MYVPLFKKICLLDILCEFSLWKRFGIAIVNEKNLKSKLLNQVCAGLWPVHAWFFEIAQVH